MNLRILALKIDDLLDYLGPKCKLFHSIMVDENKKFLKTLQFVLR